MTTEVAITKPRGIWIPDHEGPLPHCYHGVPLQLVQDIVRDITEENDHSPEDAVAILLSDIDFSLSGTFDVPPCISLAEQAAVLVAIMLERGLARPTPQA